MNLITMPQGLFRSLPMDLVRFGRDAIARVGEDVERLKAQRVFIIASRSVASDRAFMGRIESLLGHRYAGIFANVGPHVPSGDVFAAAQAARLHKADLLFSLGGGSVIDCTKLVAFVLAGGANSPESLFRIASLHERPEIDGAMPHIAVSTTLSAAEFSCAAGVTDEASRVKGVLVNPHLAPRVVVLDPALTLGTPLKVWLSTGIKALDHAVERFCSVAHQPLIDALCIEAARLLIGHLAASAGSGEAALIARAQCQIGAWLSFYGWLNVPTGLSHVLGHQIGARFGVPHGHTSGVTLPHVIRLIHAVSAPEQFVRLTRVLEINVVPDAAAFAVADVIAGLVHKFGLPTSISALGVSEDQLAALTAAAFEEMTRSRRLAPGQTAADIERVVAAAW